MKKIIPFLVFGLGLSAFGAELQNWVVVFIGGVITGASLVSLLGFIIGMMICKHQNINPHDLSIL